jgi:hypothetical protein
MKCGFSMDKSRRTGAWSRIYSDFLMPSRLPIYDQLLKRACDLGYQTCSVYSFCRMATESALDPAGRYIVLRHDVDTDARTARRLWEIERRNGCTSSFFFRLSTISPTLMKEMHETGFEASYHYEEVSLIAKQKRIRDPELIRAEMPVIRSVFRANLNYLRTITGLPMRCVASHGDFVNRSLGITNTVILEDQQFRRAVDVEFEAYDAVILGRGLSRHTDCPYPDLWEKTDPLEAMRDGLHVLHVLTHPRHWHRAVCVNLFNNISRVWEGLFYHWTPAKRSNSQPCPRI